MLLNLNALNDTPVSAEPFSYMAACGVVDEVALARVSASFPVITRPGVFPLSELVYGTAFEQLISEIQSPDLEALLGRKFGMELSGRPLMITVRGQCQKKDGRIHVDSRDKLLTCLLYLNEQSWDAEGGRLRLLRGGDDLNDVIAEIPPLGGNFIAFRRSENSWHGHEPFEGRRRCIMFNWMASNAVLAKNLGRHRLSAAFKRLRVSVGG